MCGDILLLIYSTLFLDLEMMSTDLLEFAIIDGKLLKDGSCENFGEFMLPNTVLAVVS